MTHQQLDTQLTDHHVSAEDVTILNTINSQYGERVGGGNYHTAASIVEKSPVRKMPDFVLKRRATANSSTSALAAYKKPNRLSTLKQFMIENGIS